MLFDDLPPLLRSSAQGPDGVVAAWVRREHAAKRLVRLRAGVYVDATEWKALGRRRRHLLRILAIAPRDGHLVVSHESAAAILGWAILGPWPDRVHLTDPSRTGGWRRAGAVTHSWPLTADDVIEVDGLLVTSPVRTAADLALRPGLRAATAALDSALRSGPVTKDAVREDIAARPGLRGHRLALDAIDFADARAQLPGESLTRVVLRELRAPRPELQRAYVDARGLVGIVDFAWPELGVILEFDGDVKYFDPAYRGNLTVAEVVVRERKREKRLIRLPEVRDVVRTDWAEVHRGRPLAAALRAAGVPVAYG